MQQSHPVCSEPSESQLWLDRALQTVLAFVELAAPGSVAPGWAVLGLVAPGWAVHGLVVPGLVVPVSAVPGFVPVVGLAFSWLVR